MFSYKDGSKEGALILAHVSSWKKIDSQHFSVSLSGGHLVTLPLDHLVSFIDKMLEYTLHESAVA